MNCKKIISLVQKGCDLRNLVKATIKTMRLFDREIPGSLDKQLDTRRERSRESGKSYPERYLTLWSNLGDSKTPNVYLGIRNPLHDKVVDFASLEFFGLDWVGHFYRQYFGEHEESTLMMQVMYAALSETHHQKAMDVLVKCLEDKKFTSRAKAGLFLRNRLSLHHMNAFFTRCCPSGLGRTGARNRYDEVRALLLKNNVMQTKDALGNTGDTVYALLQGGYSWEVVPAMLDGKGKNSRLKYLSQEALQKELSSSDLNVQLTNGPSFVSSAELQALYLDFDLLKMIRDLEKEEDPRTTHDAISRIIVNHKKLGPGQYGVVAGRRFNEDDVIDIFGGPVAEYVTARESVLRSRYAISIANEVGSFRQERPANSREMETLSTLGIFQDYYSKQRIGSVMMYANFNKDETTAQGPRRNRRANRSSVANATVAFRLVSLKPSPASEFASLGTCNFPMPVFFAIKPIKPGNEITWDYGDEWHAGDQACSPLPHDLHANETRAALKAQDGATHVFVTSAPQVYHADPEPLKCTRMAVTDLKLGATRSAGGGASASGDSAGSGAPRRAVAGEPTSDHECVTGPASASSAKGKKAT